jgi:hypothetical protein
VRGPVCVSSGDGEDGLPLERTRVGVELDASAVGVRVGVGDGSAVGDGGAVGDGDAVGDGVADGIGDEVGNGIGDGEGVDVGSATSRPLPPTCSPPRCGNSTWLPARS